MCCETLFIQNSFAQLLLNDTVNVKDVIISESKTSKNILASPISITKLDAKKINQLPAENIYAGLATQKGVSVITNGLFNKVINLRGFSSAATWNEANMELVDGMDLNTPGQGVSLGNLTGTNDIDVDNIELIPGSASSIYGANAFNGLLLTTTKDPFQYQGLSVLIKTGMNYIDGKNHDASFFSDCQLRYAKSINNKIAFKINFGVQHGTEWMKVIETDFDPNAANAVRETLTSDPLAPIRMAC